MTLNAAVAVVSAPASVPQGQVFTASFRAVNTGTEVWQRGLHKLGMVGDDAQWGDNRVQLPGAVAPGQSAEWSAQLIGTVAGSRTMSVRMLKEGDRWFGGTDSRAVSVEAAPVPPLASRPDPNDLLGKMVINTGPLLCVKGQVQTDTFRNDSPRRMLITAGLIWVGFDSKTQCDCHVEARRSDDSLFMVKQTDHYTDGPEGGANRLQQFAPYFALEPGEVLSVAHFANPFTAPGVQHYHVTLSLWWRWAEPPA